MNYLRITPSITDKSDPLFRIYLREINKYPLLTETEEKQLISLAQQGDEKAKEKIIVSNLRFVVSIAKKYLKRGLEIKDLIQAGNLGLIRAIYSYDIKKENKFITFAVNWIRAYILQALSSDALMVRPAYNIIVEKQKLNKQKEADNDPVSLKPDDNKQLEVLNAAEPTVMLNETMCIYSDSSMEETLYEQDRMKIINEILNTLPIKNQDVLRLYFGIQVNKMETFAISKLFGCTYVNISYIIRDSLKTLKKNHYQELKDLLY